MAPPADGGAPASAVARNLADVHRRIARACERAGRSPDEITLVGVTKTVPVERIRDLLDAGLAHLGENRFQEAIPKMRALADRAPTWHFIGHLQTNKARRAAELFDRIESVDSLRLAGVLEAAAEETGRELRVFVQVKVGDETTKGGVPLEDVGRLLDQVDRLPRVTVVGLMAIPPPRSDPGAAREDFRFVRGHFDRVRERRPDVHHLSMGMSADFEIAIEEGATEIRVGTALFGPR